MRYTETKLKGAYICDPEPIEDERGFFARCFCQKDFAKHGLHAEIRQANISYNKKQGTIRGLHYQLYPYQEDKIVSCIKGAIFDVVVDLRKDSPTYCQWVAAKLTAQNYKMLYIPKGCAHGFQTLEDDSIVYYQVTEFYNREYEKGAKWNDAAFNINWPLPVTCISAKDLQHASFVQ